MKHLGWVGGAVLALLVAGSAQAVTPTPAQKCQQGKNKEAGTYASCRQKAEAKFALTGDGVVRTATLAKCSDKYGLKWSAIEAKAAGTCPSMGDQVAIRGCLDATTTGVADGLAGNALVCGQSGSHFQPLKTGQTQCWDTTDSYIACAGTGQDGELQKGLARAYIDNGDGTITDTQTGLMWEKLRDDGSIHDKDNSYTWANAFAVKIAALNAAAASPATPTGGCRTSTSCRAW